MWKDQRRFLHDKLRSFGMTYMGAGKKIMESRIMVSFNYRSICVFFLFLPSFIFHFTFFFSSFLHYRYLDRARKKTKKYYISSVSTTVKC